MSAIVLTSVECPNQERQTRGGGGRAREGEADRDGRGKDRDRGSKTAHVNPSSPQAIHAEAGSVERSSPDASAAITRRTRACITRVIRAMTARVPVRHTRPRSRRAASDVLIRSAAEEVEMARKIDEA